MLLLHLCSKANRQQHINHHNKRQRQESEDGESHDGDDEENPADFVAFPSRRLHLEREETPRADHQIGKDDGEGKAHPITQHAVEEMTYLVEHQGQRGDEDGHAGSGKSSEGGLLRVVNVEFG